MKPQKLKATYSIEVNRYIREEIIIDEEWDDEGNPCKSISPYEPEEGYIVARLVIYIKTKIWPEMFEYRSLLGCEGYKDEDEILAWDYHMPFFGGNGTPESFFENFFSQEKVRRKALHNLDNAPWWWDYRRDRRFSWLYYKRSFDAVFPVLCEMGKVKLSMELEGVLEDGRNLRFVYPTFENGGEIYVNDNYVDEVVFYDEKLFEYVQEKLYVSFGDIARAKPDSDQINGMHDFSDLLQSMELAVEWKAHLDALDKEKRCMRLD